MELLILICSALAAALAGMSVFSNSRPPDARINQVMDEVEELKGILNQMQKSILQLERKFDKDAKDGRTELKEVLEKMADKIDKRMVELGNL
jgi:CRISPR/Cas system CSM-associated protein Csm2 small subunit